MTRLLSSLVRVSVGIYGGIWLSRASHTMAEYGSWYGYTSPASVNQIIFLVSLMVSFADTHVISPCFTFLTMVCWSATVLILCIMMVTYRKATAPPLIIIASDITSHQSVSRKISVRYFAGIFQWLTGIRTENIPLFNPFEGRESRPGPVMVFNGEKNIPADSLKSQLLILPGKGK